MVQLRIWVKNMESKKEIRERILKARNAMPKNAWEAKSKIIYEKVCKHPLFISSEKIFCYVDYRNEVCTKELINLCWKSGKKVAVPKVKGDVMEFFYIHNFSELREGYRGILEPDEASRAEADSSTLIIMPGVAFDTCRNRIGYGKGYYDRYLEEYPKCHTLALAFACQIVPEIPSAEFDVCPEVLVTEEGIYEHEFTK